MKKILAFAGSNSSTSINYELVKYAASQVSEHEVKLITLLDYPLEMFSEDLERDKGYSTELRMLRNEFKNADAIMMSVNEHNGASSAFFKNVLDWLSRLEYKFLKDKKVFLMSTSNGKRGAASSREYVEGVLPRFNGEVVESFGLGEFSENFSVKEGKITDPEIDREFQAALDRFLKQI